MFNQFIQWEIKIYIFLWYFFEKQCKLLCSGILWFSDRIMKKTESWEIIVTSTYYIDKKKWHEKPGQSKYTIILKPSLKAVYMKRDIALLAQESTLGILPLGLTAGLAVPPLGLSLTIQLCIPNPMVCSIIPEKKGHFDIVCVKPYSYS